MTSDGAAEHLTTMEATMRVIRQSFIGKATTWASLALILVIAAHIQPAESIGCFVCHSINKSNPMCEDPFNAYQGIYKGDCQAGRKNRSGRFPGTSCIKFTAWLGSYTVVVRDCTVDNGDTTSDTEMGRESHCWMVNMVNYNDLEMYGCALACHTDGCNTGSDVRPTAGTVLFTGLVGAAYYYILKS